MDFLHDDTLQKLEQEQNLGWRFGTRKMHLSPPPHPPLPPLGCCPF